MKRIILGITVGLLTFGCAKNRKVENPPLAPTELKTDTVIADKVQTPRNSLDYLGVYKGILPCADCSGTETSIELAEDFTFVITSKYLEKSTKSFEEKGTYRWNDAGDGIILNSGKSSVQYIVGQKMLTQLDGDGNKITGELASRFILKKIPEAEAAKGDALPKAIATRNIIGKWKLVELNAVKIKPVGDKESFIEFKEANNFGAFGGCNTMGGHYEVKASRIRFMRVMSTLMACPEMKTEDQLKSALETCDNFVTNRAVLLLRKGEQTLAKFEPLAK